MVESSIKFELENPWLHYTKHPLKTFDGYILRGNCGCPAYSRKACWEPLLDDLCISCPYHCENQEEAA